MHKIILSLEGITNNKDFKEMQGSTFESETKTFLKNSKATSLVEHDILKISYRYQHVYVLTYISKISTGYL